ncbi:RNA polymerase sigma-70 factor [Mucilaginibacter sabulilitoris]|uniref:RNA polymerase sigma-70 factor n=1 Tax=Mucilaginibacter sabulilitoris TaxID=1173583 RepID=A0ABZ0TM00_9SPHI|nr:RNA polymerase sigma-70 factor [Mucilaginibacter sabulilitoris]WPU93218.1 RNA polymerase sigma-70 factor [Mucilaginibacter sabulilitoris]
MIKPATYSDHELLIALHCGDKKAFEALYFRYFTPLSCYAYKKLQDEYIVEELVQDVFVDLWKKREELDTEGEVAGLLYAMLRNKALHELRARMIQSKHFDAFAFLHKDDVADKLMDGLYARQMEEKMQEAVNKLSPQCKNAFTLSRYEHLSYKEIAEKMSISINTVEKHIGKALQLLRREFEEYHLPILILIGLLELSLQR